MISPPFAVVDFETDAIIDGSGQAPRPVGVSVNHQYYAWGHPTGNNCSYEDGRRALAAVWDQPLIFHHGKFDIGVAMQHMGLPWPKVWHDTMYLIYLDNPIAPSVSLKPSAYRLLGMPPDEQDAVRDWLVNKGIVPWNSKSWGAHISKAPGDLVGKYAEGDTKRTELLYERLYQSVVDRGMYAAYRRELELTPILYEAEHVGVRIDREQLEWDLFEYQAIFEKMSVQICRVLGADINLDSGAELASALEKSGLARTLPRTPTGRLSTARAALEGAVTDPVLLQLLRYRGALKTLIGTFMKPWLNLSDADGRVHPSWNSVRGDIYGTRTGRLSCSAPNLQNVPTEFEGLDLEGHPLLPFMRRYILPDEGHVLVAADYNGQEMRLLAHFAEGRAAEIYRKDPRADFHQVARNIVHNEAALDLKRKQVKITGFSLIYGAGVPALASQLGVPHDTARLIRNAYLNAMPGLREFQKDVAGRSQVKTWGGRIIPVEPPKMVDGQMWSFEYKLANHLIQGSAADQTKQSIIDYHKNKVVNSRFLMTVHDENVTSVPIDDLRDDVKALCDSMETLPGFDVPFIAEVEVGDNWHDLKEYNETYPLVLQ